MKSPNLSEVFQFLEIKYCFLDPKYNFNFFIESIQSFQFLSNMSVFEGINRDTEVTVSQFCVSLL